MPDAGGLAAGSRSCLKLLISPPCRGSSIDCGCRSRCRILRFGCRWEKLLHDGLRGQALIYCRAMSRMHSTGGNFI